MNIDEITHSPLTSSPTITSGNLSSQLRNYKLNKMKKVLNEQALIGLSAQYQSWAMQHF